MSDAVFERTGGQLKFELHQWVELGYTGPEMLGIYEAGIQKIGELGGSYLIGEMPLIALPGLPFLSTTEDIPLVLDTMRPYVQDALDKYNIMVLADWEYPNNLWSQFEVNTRDDVKKLKIRSHPPAIAMLTNLGGSAITMPAAEIYQALATGIVNGVGFSVTGGINFGFAEVTDHLYLSPPLNSALAFMVVNKDALNSLPPDVQQVLIDTAKEFHPIVIDRVRYPTAEQLAELGKQVTIHDELDPQLVEWMVSQGALPYWDEWAVKFPETKDALNALLVALGHI
jgi:TRAP-type C4-dicarboxylate transport system substrate-binding protein